MVKSTILGNNKISGRAGSGIVIRREANRIRDRVKQALARRRASELQQYLSSARSQYYRVNQLIDDLRKTFSGANLSNSRIRRDVSNRAMSSINNVERFGREKSKIAKANVSRASALNRARGLSRTKVRRSAGTFVQDGVTYRISPDGTFERIALAQGEQERRNRVKLRKATAKDIFEGVNTQTQRGQEEVIRRLQPFIRQQEKQLAQSRLEATQKGRNLLTRQQNLQVKKQDYKAVSDVLGIRFQPRLTITRNLAKYKSKLQKEKSNLSVADINKLGKWATNIQKRGDQLSQQEQTFISFLKNQVNTLKNKSNKVLDKAPKPLSNVLKLGTNASQRLNNYFINLGVGAFYTPARIAQGIEKALFVGKIGLSSTFRNNSRKFWTKLMRENVRSSPAVQKALRDAFKDPATYVFPLIPAFATVKGKKPIGYLEKEPVQGGKLAKALKNEAIVTKSQLKDRLKVIEFDEKGQIKKIEIINKNKKKVEQVRVKPKNSNKVKYLEYDDKGKLIKSGFIKKVNPKTAKETKAPVKAPNSKVKVYEYDANGKLIRTSFARRIKGSTDRTITVGKKPFVKAQSSNKVKILFYDAKGKFIKSTFGKRITGKKDRFLKATTEVKVKDGKGRRDKIIELDSNGRVVRSYFKDSTTLSKEKPTKTKVDDRIKVYEFDANGNLKRSFYGKKKKTGKDNFKVKEDGKIELTNNNIKSIFKNKKGQASITITRLKRLSKPKTKTLLFKNKKARFKLNYNANVIKALSLSGLALRKAQSISFLPQDVTLTELQKLVNRVRDVEKTILKNVKKLQDLQKNKQRNKVLSRTTTTTKTKTATKSLTKQKAVTRTRTSKPKRPKTVPKLPKIPLSKLKFDSKKLDNRVLKFEGKFRERKFPNKKPSKSNPIITKTIRVNDTKNRALRRVAKRVDNSLSASLTLKVVGVGKAKKDIKKPSVLAKFRTKKSKATPVLRLVEKNKNRFDTKGEKSEAKRRRKA